MHTPRKTIGHKLFELLLHAYPWQTADLKLRFPDNVPGMAQPAMFLVKPSEDADQPTGWGASRWHVQYYAIIFFRADGCPSDVAPADVLDDILDAIDKAFIPTLGRAQTLGGLVTNCWVNGKVEIDNPIFHEQAAIVLPISVLVGG